MQTLNSKLFPGEFNKVCTILYSHNIHDKIYLYTIFMKEYLKALYTGLERGGKNPKKVHL